MNFLNRSQLGKTSIFLAVIFMLFEQITSVIKVRSPKDLVDKFPSKKIKNKKKYKIIKHS